MRNKAFVVKSIMQMLILYVYAVQIKSIKSLASPIFDYTAHDAEIGIHIYSYGNRKLPLLQGQKRRALRWSWVKSLHNPVIRGKVFTCAKWAKIICMKYKKYDVTLFQDCVMDEMYKCMDKLIGPVKT